VSHVVRCGGEHAAGCGNLHVESVGELVALASIRAQQADGGLVERDPALLVGLGVLLPRLAAFSRNGAAHVQHRTIQVEIIPAQGAQLSATGAGRHGQPHQHAPPQVHRERCGGEPLLAVEGVDGDCASLRGGSAASSGLTAIQWKASIVSPESRETGSSPSGRTWRRITPS
jgi:hypothetical protein